MSAAETSDLGGPRKSSVVAAELITEAIADGRLGPGARLKEDELARFLGISRTPVREALLMLRAKGLVEMSPNRGATVRTYDAEHLDDLYGLRALLEGHAARLAAGRAEPEQLAALEASCARFAALAAAGEDFAAIVQENASFHRLVRDAAHSRLVADTLETVVELPLTLRAFSEFSPDELRRSADDHRRLARAIAAGDGERAERIMHEHILEARDVLVARLAGAA